MHDKIKAWHFTDGGKLRDGRPVPALGEWLEHDGPLVLCESGLHASELLIDALQYAPGHALHRVTCGGEAERGEDKLVATRRRIEWTIDAGDVLRAFARWCALQVVDHWSAPDVVVRWLRTGDESLRYAALDAAWSASWDAALDAAGSAALDAALDAAWSASWDAALDTAWSASRSAQNEQLERMVREARGGRTEWIWEE